MSASVPAVTWSEYVRATIGSDQQVEAARKTSVNQTTISRWLNGGQAGAVDNVAAFARGYRRPVLEAFLAAGFLSPEEAGATVTITRLEHPDDETLIALLAERLRRRAKESDGDGDAAPNTTAEDVTGSIKLPGRRETRLEGDRPRRRAARDDVPGPRGS